MTENRIDKMNSFFAERIAECGAREKELSADGRGDEAVFEKVRANVYDIFRTVLSAGVKACKADPEAVRRFYSDRLETIPSGWAASYENAKAHDDAVKMRIESIKLGAVAEIREVFETVMEEEK